MPTFFKWTVAQTSATPAAMTRGNDKVQTLKSKRVFPKLGRDTLLLAFAKYLHFASIPCDSRLTALPFIILHHQHSQSCQFWRKVKYSISFSCIRINKIGDFQASATALTIMLCLWELRSRDSLSLENPTVLKTGLSNALCTPRTHHMVLRVRL